MFLIDLTTLKLKKYTNVTAYASKIFNLLKERSRIVSSALMFTARIDSVSMAPTTCT